MDIAALYQRYLAAAGVTTDTRRIPSGSMFFALRGERFNANLFATEALDRGACFAVIDEALPDTPYSDRLILVPDVLTALQALAGYHRQLLRCPVLAITGSNGKTTTKELMAAVFSKKYKTTATRGNLNNHVGLPLTLLSAAADTEFLIVEMGANHQREIAGYCRYADPDSGLITNVGRAHLEGFGGEEGVIRGKTELYEYIGRKGGKLFVPSGSPVLARKAMEYSTSGHIIYYGQEKGDHCTGFPVSAGEFLAIRTSDNVLIQTRLTGRYNFDNVMAAICTGRYFGVEDNDIKDAIENYEPANNRSQKLIIGSNTVLLDAYNANPSSMTEALRNFAALDVPDKITILGEMMELGPYSHDEHLKIIDMVLQMDLSKRIFVGEGFNMLRGSREAEYFETTEALREWYLAQHFENTTQLIKGSRKNALEKILPGAGDGGRGT